MARITGFSRLPGTARNYVNNETGEVYTRRQYEKLVSAAGARQRKSAAKATTDERAMRRYRSLAQDLWRERKRDNPGLKYGDVRNSPEMKGIIRDLKSKDSKRQVRALEALGRRRGIPGWVPPGSSDAFRAGQLKRPRSRSAGAKARARNKG